MNAARVGLDLAKTVFQVHGVDITGQTVVRRRLARSQSGHAPTRPFTNPRWPENRPLLGDTHRAERGQENAVLFRSMYSSTVRGGCPVNRRTVSVGIA
jgi:hypothetical protein